MIYAYDRDYLYYAQINFGHMLDFAVNTCEFSPTEYFQMFLASNVCRQFEDGNPAYIAGKTGCELVHLVVSEVKEQELDVQDAMYLDRTPEYWLGWSLAHYAWERNCKFSYIFRAVSPDFLLDMYDTLHEADITKFVYSVDITLNEYYQQSALARYRAYYNLSQAMLAEKSGVNVRIIQSYEQGLRDINKAQFETVVKLAEVLECDPVELLNQELPKYKNCLKS